MNNLKESKILYVILSILIAAALWLYVVNEVNPNASDTIKNVPVNVSGLDVLESRGLMITRQSTDDLDVKVTGNRKSLVKLMRDNITVTADVSGVAEEGEYDIRCTVALPGSITTGTATVNDRDSYRVRFTVEKKIKKTVEVRGEFTGKVAEGYQAESFILSPSSIEITGPSSLIEPVEYALVTLSAANLDETYSGILPFELVNQDGSMADLGRIECAAPTVYVVYPIVMVREIELKVSFLPGGGATEENVIWEIAPETIQISGKESDISGIGELVFGPIDLAEISGTTSLELPVSLPAGVTNESGIDKAVITIRIDGLTTKTFETDRIELINPPAGFTAEVVTQSLKVTVRGSAEAVERVKAQQLRVVADLSEVSESEGQFRVPVKVYMEGAGEAGVVGRDYSISVNLSK